MATFHEFLISRFEAGGFSTEDVLASFLPLAKQVLKAHAESKVAPLEGVGDLSVEGVRLWFSEASTKQPTLNSAKLRLLDRPAGAFEVVQTHKRTINIDDGQSDLANLKIGSREKEIAEPVYLPGYVCWEHQVGHHDPVSDVFSLGLILASLACSLNFNEPEDLKHFVSSRRNLFRLNPQLHPVVAKAIVKMTELSRHSRPQDLATLLHNLEHYRDQAADFDFDLASEGTAPGKRKQVILGKLQERLFEVSRRNRLLHFRAALQSVNLTHASVPLSFSVENIRPDQILTWRGDFAKGLSSGAPVSLNRYLNFTEQVYLPSVLDRIRAEAARDANEYGFEQLRLVLCFLKWSDIKQSPPEQYDSPLVLLPVKLVKKKGIRDSYWLQPQTTEAEVNPVVRHLFKQLYDIELPVSIDLEETTLDQFYEELSQKITSSEPGVTTTKIDRPRIDLIHDQAKRRLDRYRRSMRISGRGVRSFLDLDYSYDPSNFNPLGLAIFRARIRPSPTHLREIVQESPPPRVYLVPPDDSLFSEKERQFYSLHEQSDDNPFNWNFDLCRLTLGNFHYRKMTLVRDYAELLKNDFENPAFDGVFSLAPRPVESESPKIMDFEDRFHVVACDPTQTMAIGLAREGTSYIIQGPPGTGKSQTITNLIADYVVRGKKVLFVCEKRAAIDVVYARLKQQGLHQLCCLIHDSQADKKEFIADLKVTYDALMEEKEAGDAWHRRRKNLLTALRKELEPLDLFNREMLADSSMARLLVRELIERSIATYDDVPDLTKDQQELLPQFGEWAAQNELIERLRTVIGDICEDGILANHPLSMLSPSVATQEQPSQWIASRLSRLQRALPSLIEDLRSSGVPHDYWRTFGDLRQLVDYAAHVAPLVKRKLIGIIDAENPISKRFADASKQQDALKASLAETQQHTKNWTRKLPADDLPTALEQARVLEGRFTSVFKPSWWRLRKVLKSHYNFGAHAVRPSWKQILTALKLEYDASTTVSEHAQSILSEFSITDSLDAVVSEVDQTQAFLRSVPTEIQPLHRLTLSGTVTAGAILKIATLQEIVDETVAQLDGMIDDYSGVTLEKMQDHIDLLEESIDMLPDFLFCLGLVAQLDKKSSRAIRCLPVTITALEAAILRRSTDDMFRNSRVLNRFNGTARDAHAEQLSRLSHKWHEVNAGVILEKARRNFLEHVQLSSRSATGLTPEQKEFKAVYSRGRRELEHEFGKVMRHKSIRDLVSGDSGRVIVDLKPVWLMSPLSVCDTLPLRVDQFDVVVFDEASQITLEEAVPAIFRSCQTIVVGDEMQLPPTNFFSAKGDSGEDEGLVVSENGQTFEYDLSSNSFLNHAAKNLSSRMLGWHYRSRSESLISFSNWAFYQGRLLTVPERRAGSEARPEISAEQPSDGQPNARFVLDRPISFHLMRNGVYEARGNSQEASYIAHMVRELLKDENHPTLGIIAFSEAQQSEIERALNDLAEEDKAFADRLELENEREVDGQFAGLLVKNLENIQGDERDIVILSICYGRQPSGKMLMNFGPINQSGGEKRLNVAFSRAKHHMVVVSSIRHMDITNDYNDGANCLKTYLQYAAECSCGDSKGAHHILQELAVWRDAEVNESGAQHIVVQQLAAALKERGYAIETAVGMSHFRCDLAVRLHGELTHRLGILVDTDLHYQQTDLFEREMMRPQLLKNFGWSIAHVLMRDWYQDRSGVIERIVKLIQQPHEQVRTENEEDDAWAELDDINGSASEDVPVITEAIKDQEDSSVTVPDGSANSNGIGTKHYLEFFEGHSAKFWEVVINDNVIAIRFGRIGTKGQMQTKVFADQKLALKSAKALIAGKLAKGYIEKKLS